MKSRVVGVGGVGTGRSVCGVVLALLLSFPVLALAQTNAPAVSALSPKAAIVGTLGVSGTQTIAPIGNCSRVSVTITGDVTGTDDDGGGLDQVSFQLWDDGIMQDAQGVAIPVGSTMAVSITLGFQGQFGVGVPGVGIQVIDVPGVAILYSNDPFIPGDVPGSCVGEVIAVPTLSTWGLALLAALCGVLGLRRAGRRA